MVGMPTGSECRPNIGICDNCCGEIDGHTLWDSDVVGKDIYTGNVLRWFEIRAMESRRWYLLRKCPLGSSAKWV